MALETIAPPAALDLPAPLAEEISSPRARLGRASSPSARIGRALKTVWEWNAAAFALLAVVPLLAMAALWIKLDSRGPIFYRQTRVGRDGVPFTMIKLRTMYVGADRSYSSLRDGEVPVKQPLDGRITRAGRLLRRTSIDELPQLFNVLAGEMALIGPRPPLPHELPLYDPEAITRFHVRPGLTGLWQVSGRADLTWTEAGRLDRQYVEQWTLRSDLSILLRTIPAVLSGRGAY